MSNAFVFEIHIPELQVLADAIRGLNPSVKPAGLPETPRPTTPVQSAQPTPLVSAPAQAAPVAATAAPTSPTQAYSTAPTTPQPPAYPSNLPPAAPVYYPAAAVPGPIPQSTAPTAPLAAPTSYALDDLARAASAVADAGKRQDILNLITGFGVRTLAEIPPDKYGAFATALRGLGARL